MSPTAWAAGMPSRCSAIPVTRPDRFRPATQVTRIDRLRRASVSTRRPASSARASSNGSGESVSRNPVYTTSGCSRYGCHSAAHRITASNCVSAASGAGAAPIQIPCETWLALATTTAVAVRGLAQTRSHTGPERLASFTLALGSAVLHALALGLLGAAGQARLLPAPTASTATSLTCGAAFAQARAETRPTAASGHSAALA